MKKTIVLFSSLIFLAACAGEKSMTETLQICSPETKVHLSDEVNAVWDASDQVSVFFNGGVNECWDYSGADGASKGSISHEGSTYRVGSGRFTAVYPYNSGASISGDVITTILPAEQTYRSASWGNALLVSSTDNASLQFRYACGFVRLRLCGAGVVKSVQVAGNNGERLAGTAQITLSSDTPEMTVTSGSQVVTLSGGTAMMERLESGKKDFWLAVCPGTYTKGLTVTVKMATGSDEVIDVTGPVSVGAGEVLDVDARVLTLLNVSVDMTRRDAFSPVLPAGTVSREGSHTFTSGGNEYALVCHPSEGRAYGTYEGSFLIGFAGAWIQLPALAGYALFEVEYTTAGQAGQPYLSATATDPKPISNQIPDKITVGQKYTMTLSETVPDKAYYLIVGAGNLRISYLTLRYLAQ